mmetsp:Transcript_21181/g.39396  ORF Transcript_21181/g.39396 Transcript_21181/m.39396 type:complete len:389 (-) Transcript_21181:85-1251(-)
MDPREVDDTSKELKDYLEKHKIHELFTKIVEELLKNRPDQPLQTIADYLATEFDVRAGNSDSSEQRPTEIIETYHESDSSESESEADEEGDETVSNLVEMPKPAARPAARRTSVSAGVLSLANARQHTAPVFEKSEDEKAEIRSALESSTIFKSCDDSALKTIVMAFEPYSFSNEHVIIQQGDLIAEHFFLLKSGTAEAFIGDTSVKAYVSGDGFGELAMLYNQPRAATVKATSDVEVWRLDQKTFKSIIVASVLEKREKLVEFLKRCQLMQSLSDLEIMTLADSLETRKFTRGEEIIKQGEVGNDFFVLESGAVQCLKDGEPVLSLKDGDYFGEIALLYDMSRQATVVVESETASVLAIDRKTFQRLMGPLGEILRRNPLHQQFLPN